MSRPTVRIARRQSSREEDYVVIEIIVRLPDGGRRVIQAELSFREFGKASVGATGECMSMGLKDVTYPPNPGRKV
jgi:hypothetical protein